MAAATTIAPALSPTAPTRIRKPISRTQADPPEAPVREVEAAGSAVAEPEHAGNRSTCGPWREPTRSASPAPG